MGQTMPNVQPMVYLGDVDLEVGGPTHAFQDTISYVLYGSRLDPGAADRDDLLIYFVPASEIGVDIVDLWGLAATVDRCIERAGSTGWPVLHRARGTWFTVT
jgi:hypothetical protein